MREVGNERAEAEDQSSTPQPKSAHEIADTNKLEEKGKRIGDELDALLDGRSTTCSKRMPRSS